MYIFMRRFYGTLIILGLSITIMTAKLLTIPKLHGAVELAVYFCILSLFALLFQFGAFREKYVRTQGELQSVRFELDLAVTERKKLEERYGQTPAQLMRVACRNGMSQEELAQTYARDISSEAYWAEQSSR